MSNETKARAALADHVRRATDEQLVGSLDVLALELDLARLAGESLDGAKVRARMELSCEHSRRLRATARELDDVTVAADLRSMAAHPYGDMLASERNLLNVLEEEVERRHPGARAAAEAWLDGFTLAELAEGAAPDYGYLHKLLEGAGL